MDYMSDKDKAIVISLLRVGMVPVLLLNEYWEQLDYYGVKPIREYSFWTAFASRQEAQDFCDTRNAERTHSDESTFIIDEVA